MWKGESTTRFSALLLRFYMFRFDLLSLSFACATASTSASDTKECDRSMCMCVVCGFFFRFFFIYFQQSFFLLHTSYRAYIQTKDKNKNSKTSRIVYERCKTLSETRLRDFGIYFTQRINVHAVSE